MTHTHNFGEFEQIFREQLDGAFDINDIHEIYVYYKEAVVFESAHDFLQDWFKTSNIDMDLIYIKTN